MLLIMLLAGVYFGGRASFDFGAWGQPKVEGAWELTLPAGFVRQVEIIRLEDGNFSLGTGGVLSGVYQYKDGHLVVVKPGDKRMVGLDWRWDGKQFMLVGEPSPPPTGASYAGAVMAPLAD